MAVQSHIESLETRHQELESKLSELLAGSSVSDVEIGDIKRQKLQIKDRIEQLKSEHEVN